MEETERASANDNLLQGDILRLEDEKSQVDFGLAMILNADCDMQNKKHDGMIAVLPIYTFQQYLEKFWLTNFFIQQKNEALKVLQSTFDISNQHIEDLLSWLEQSRDHILPGGAAEVFDKYDLSAKQIIKADEALVKLSKVYEGIAGTKLRAVSRFAPLGEGKTEKYCRVQILEAKKQMGDDHFFITEVKNDKSVGYVIRMRRIYTIPEDACFKSETAMLTSIQKPISAYRICRLTPHYKFKASQLFAYQYSRIGLPDDVTALSELAIADMAHHFQDNSL